MHLNGIKTLVVQLLPAATKKAGTKTPCLKVGIGAQPCGFRPLRMVRVMELWASCWLVMITVYSRPRWAAFSIAAVRETVRESWTIFTLSPSDSVFCRTLSAYSLTKGPIRRKKGSIAAAKNTKISHQKWKHDRTKSLQTCFKKRTTNH